MNIESHSAKQSLQVHLLREGILESVHTARAAIADSRGHILSAIGEATAPTFIRSSLKPFQALAAVTSGAAERFSLTERDLAIMCGSHRGEMMHVRQVFGMLWRADLDAEVLMCPTPINCKSPLHHNCSGKHAGFLIACKIHGWSFQDYLDRNHPVQETVRTYLTDLLHMPAAELLSARDDCGAPTYQVQLSQMAALYAQLSCGDRLELETIRRAMTHEPEMVAGVGHFDTELMKATEGELVSKAGAEGVQCIGRSGDGMGLAIKVEDGSSRAKYAIAIHLLRQLGWILPTTADELSTQFCQVGPYTRLEVEGAFNF